MRKYADVSGKMIFEKRPIRVLLFAKSPKKFMVRHILKFPFLASR